jgi:hypothetical protein
MNTRIPSLIVLAAGGVLAVASALAQGQSSTSGDTGAAQPQSSTGGAKSSTKSSKHASTKKTTHTKSTSHKMHSSTTSTSGAGTSATDPEMKRCMDMTDRTERADCASKAWESTHPAS